MNEYFEESEVLGLYVYRLLKEANIKKCKWTSTLAYETDENGQSYTHVSRVSDGIRSDVSEHGACFNCIKKYSTPIGAVGAYMEALHDFIKGKIVPIQPYTGILLWRCQPKLEKSDDGYSVYSRLVFIPEGTRLTQSVIVEAV